MHTSVINIPVAMPSYFITSQMEMYASPGYARVDPVCAGGHSEPEPSAGQPLPLLPSHIHLYLG